MKKTPPFIMHAYNILPFAKCKKRQHIITNKSGASDRRLNILSPESETTVSPIIFPIVPAIIKYVYCAGTKTLPTLPENIKYAVNEDTAMWILISSVIMMNTVNVLF